MTTPALVLVGVVGSVIAVVVIQLAVANQARMAREVRADLAGLEAAQEVSAQVPVVSALPAAGHADDEASGWPMVSEVSEIPDCDIHSQLLGMPGVPAAYDAETKAGPWAFMCPDCFERHGPGGLGLGVGQRLVLKADPPDLSVGEVLDDSHDPEWEPISPDLIA